METKYLLNRKKFAAALEAVFLAGFAACAFAAPPADRGLELRQRRDSVEVETQTLKRQGKPIEDLEALSAKLRDTIESLRGKAPQAAAQREEPEKQGLPYLDKIPYIEEILAFRPSGAFDWVIVGTGAVALLSGLMLLAGLFAGRKKKRAAVPKKQQVSRKINLAPTSTQQRAVPDVNNNNNEPPPRDSVAEFQSLVENLRKVSPPPPKMQSPFAMGDYEPRTYAPPPAAKEPEPRRPAPPPPPPPPPEEPAAPAPLIVNAPETPSSPSPPVALSGKPLASEVLSARTPPVPPPSVPTAAGSPPKPPQAGGTGFPAFSTLVIAAAKDGVDDMEISRRYQLSVDQVKLILRMERNKHP
jgi:hypothetical protein